MKSTDRGGSRKGSKETEHNDMEGEGGTETVGT